MKGDFDWNAIRSFLTIARAGSLTAAARRLNIDHSTLSRRISSLEAALCAQLFDRRTQGYVLTEPGERLRARAEEMEAVASAILASVGNTRLTVAGAVRIGAPDGFGTRFLAPRIGKLCARHQELDIELVATPRVFSLSRREADIAISLARPVEGRLHGRRLTDYELGVYGARSYVDSLPPIRAPEDFVHHRFIGYIDDLIYAPELNYVSLVAPNIRPSLKSSNLVAQFNATCVGPGFCVLPCFMADPEPGLVRVLPNEIRLIRSFWLLMHSEIRNLARVRVTADFIVEEVQAAYALFMPNGPARPETAEEVETQ